MMDEELHRETWREITPDVQAASIGGPLCQARSGLRRHEPGTLIRDVRVATVNHGTFLMSYHQSGLHVHDDSVPCWERTEENPECPTACSSWRSRSVRS